MDGLLSGLTSIVPTMPDQTTIIDRSGVKGPPVEIMPLPSNSFMSDDAAAELLNNPFTLNLDKNKYSGANSGKTGKMQANAGRTASADEPLTDALLREAYTLSLSNEENAPAAEEAARELSVMRNYEMLGKTAARQIYKKTPDTGATASPPSPTADGELIQINERIRNLLSMSAVLENEVFVPVMEKQGSITQTISVHNVPPAENTAAEAAEPLQPVLANASSQPSAGRQDISVLYNLAGLQLSASDIEMILTLEPDLQEAMLNMFGGTDTGRSDKPAVAVLGSLLADGAADQPVGQAFTLMPNDTLIPPSQQVAVPLYPFERTITPNAVGRAQIQNAPDDVRAALPADEEVARLAMDAVISGRAQNTVPVALRGDMANLKKINELPYSLYIFGTVVPDKKGIADDNEEIDAFETPENGGRRRDNLLRISEAVRMASVLHNLYYGGSGRFPEETPWYGPYVRYALKNGIIKSNDFSDYNEYATRAETAYIFSGCVPNAEFPIINYVSDIPDVMERYGYGDRIFLLLRAGVMTRPNREGSFYPERTITKTEAAAIIGRIATPSDRKRIVQT